MPTMPILHRCAQKYCLIFLKEYYAYVFLTTLFSKETIFLYTFKFWDFQRMMELKFFDLGRLDFQKNLIDTLFYVCPLDRKFHNCYIYFASEAVQLLRKMPPKQENHTVANTRCKNSKRRHALPLKSQVIQMNKYGDYKEQVYKRFHQFNRKQACKNIKNTLLTLLGRHTSVPYHLQYNFRQQWEMKGQNTVQDGYQISQAHTWLSIIRLFLFGACMWGISIATFFPLQNNLWVKILLLLISTIETIKYAINVPCLSPRQRIIEFLQFSISLTYSIIIISYDKQFPMMSWQSRVVAIVLITQMYLKLSKIYISIKNYHISAQYRDIVNLFDLFVLLIAITHVFVLFWCYFQGCVLFVTSELNTQVNWVLNIGVQHRDWLEKYIYSVYFATTTLLTVGYGDIAPTNVTEISAILVTEFIGIAIFGYAVNKIGAALSSMKEKSQKLQKDLGTVENFGKNCHLKPAVICKMRTEVINSKQLDQDLCIQEQKELLQKFSEDLRQKIQILSSLKVLKNSIFVIANWSGKLQSKIAHRLVKQVYKAQEVLPQNYGKQKLYILDKGKIDILNCSKQANRSLFEKVLKSMSAHSNCQVLVQNVYGYSAVISSRHINLNAVAKETSICYTLTKGDFLELLQECEQDLEHYHEIKCKIDFSRIPQQFETPFIVDIRQHYIPSPVRIITRRKHHTNKNPRAPTQRKVYRSHLQIISPSSKTMSLKQDLSVQSLQYFRQTLHSRPKIDNTSNSGMPAASEHKFECYRNYEKYYRKANIDNVIGRARKNNYCREIAKSVKE